MLTNLFLLGLGLLIIAAIVAICIIARNSIKLRYDLLSNADANRPVFVQIFDDTDKNYIINLNEVGLIKQSNKTKDDEESYIIEIFLKDNMESPLEFIYNDELTRDRIFNALYDYNIEDEQD